MHLDLSVSGNVIIEVNWMLVVISIRSTGYLHIVNSIIIIIMVAVRFRRMFCLIGAKAHIYIYRLGR